MLTPPSGTVTFLFTDVEGSTRLWEEFGGDMPAALERHDQILRTGIESAGGFVFTTAGDAFAAAFADPVSAVDAAVAVQRALNTEDWGRIGTIRVRMALHTGIAEERDGDYFGPVLNRCARILGVGHGEQILISLATERLAGARLTGDVALVSLGEHYLKDLGEPAQLYQLTHPALRDDFPPLVSVTDHPNNLPVQLSSFIGRDQEVRDVVKRLNDNRLLTLTGVGGSGKTRLALQAAAEALADYRRGAWLVELAPVGDPDLIVNTISDALRIPSGATTTTTQNKTPTELLVDFLRDRQLLLVLDNCEHVIGAVAHLVTDLLRSCPQLTVLATSREGLGVPGEAMWQVPSLSLPRDDAAAIESDAVQLFISRAEAADPTFTTNPASLAAIAQICRRLDGMPLAIELAASRTRMLSPTEIAERLDDRFRLLTGGKRTALPRHQTLDATVDWSYDLLTPNEQVVFRRLASFRGGFSLKLAERVAGGGDIDGLDVLDLVGQLVDKSMVSRDEVTRRFEMLETLRQYALRKLTESDEADEIRSRHLDAMVELFAESVAPLRSPDELVTIRRLETDHDNLRTAIVFGLENGQEASAVELVLAASPFWNAAGHVVDHFEWTSRSAPHVDRLDDEGLRSDFLFWVALAAMSRGEPDTARTYVEQATEIADRIGDHPRMAAARFAGAWLRAVDHDHDRGVALGYEALELDADGEDPYLTAAIAQFLTYAERMRQNIPEALAAAQKAEQAARAVGAPTVIARSLAFKGMVLREQGDFQGEIDAAAEAYDVFRSVDNKPDMLFTVVCGAISKAQLGNHEDALHDLAIAEDMYDDIGVYSIVELHAIRSRVHQLAGNTDAALVSIQVGLGEWSGDAFDNYLVARLSDLLQMIAVSSGDVDDSARLEGFALRAEEEAARLRPTVDLADHERTSQLQVANLGAARYEDLKAEGALMTTEQAIALAGDVAARVRLDNQQ